jgi:hypothetical protein
MTISYIKDTLYNTTKNTTIRNVTVGYHSQIILLIKKIIIQWGMNLIFLYLPMSDNMHYVNLMPNKLLSILKVGNCPYFARLLRKITRRGGMQEVATSRLSKISKSLINIGFQEKKIKKGLKMNSRLCKLGVKYA